LPLPRLMQLDDIISDDILFIYFCQNKNFREPYRYNNVYVYSILLLKQ